MKLDELLKQLLDIAVKHGTPEQIEVIIKPENYSNHKYSVKEVGYQSPNNNVKSVNNLARVEIEYSSHRY